MPRGIWVPKEHWRGGHSGASRLTSDHASWIRDLHVPGILGGLDGDAGIDIPDRGTLLGSGGTTGAADPGVAINTTETLIYRTWPLSRRTARGGPQPAITADTDAADASWWNLKRFLGFSLI